MSRLRVAPYRIGTPIEPTLPKRTIAHFIGMLMASLNWRPAQMNVGPLNFRVSRDFG